MFLKGLRFYFHMLSQFILSIKKKERGSLKNSYFIPFYR